VRVRHELLVLFHIPCGVWTTRVVGCVGLGRQGKRSEAEEDDDDGDMLGESVERNVYPDVVSDPPSKDGTHCEQIIPTVHPPATCFALNLLLCLAGVTARLYAVTVLTRESLQHVCEDVDAGAWIMAQSSLIVTLPNVSREVSVTVSLQCLPLRCLTRSASEWT
jgi:hypothetical protein